MQRPRFTSYKPPAKNSPAALADVRALLFGARSLDGVTPAILASRHRLSIERAEYELRVALQKRAPQ